MFVKFLQQDKIEKEISSLKTLIKTRWKFLLQKKILISRLTINVLKVVSVHNKVV